MPDDRSNRPEAGTALDDPGTAQVLLFVGWIPPAITSLIAGVIVAFRTGSLGALVVVVIGGTLVGYIASLVVLFTVGHMLEQQGVGRRVANAFVVLDVAVGVVAALVIAAQVAGS
jgi:hypothetical protein